LSYFKLSVIEYLAKFRLLCFAYIDVASNGYSFKYRNTSQRYNAQDKERFGIDTLIAKMFGTN